MPQSSCNYLNELKAVEQLFHQAFGTASAALPPWQWCSTELHPPKMASGLEEQPCVQRHRRKNGLMELMMLEGDSCAEQVIWLLTCSRSAGAGTLTGAHLSALTGKFGVGTSLGTAEGNLSCQSHPARPRLPIRAVYSAFVVNCFTHCFFVVHQI